MATFRYTAVTAAGETRHGTMEATDEKAVIRALQREGSIPMRAEPAGAGGGLSRLLGADVLGGGGVGKQAVADMTRELAVMLGAGLDLDRALRFLVETAPNRRVRTVLERVRATVRDGGSLTAALAQQPESFAPIYVGMVRAGEAGGRLAPTLDRLAGLLERQRALASGIRSAMIYPAVLVVAAIGSITLLLVQVLPQFTPLFAQNGGGAAGADAVPGRCRGGALGLWAVRIAGAAGGRAAAAAGVAQAGAAAGGGPAAAAAAGRGGGW